MICTINLLKLLTIITHKNLNNSSINNNRHNNISIFHHKKSMFNYQFNNQKLSIKDMAITEEGTKFINQKMLVKLNTKKSRISITSKLVSQSKDRQSRLWCSARFKIRIKYIVLQTETSKFKTLSSKQLEECPSTMITLQLT
jgi:hypothetical protein